MNLVDIRKEIYTPKFRVLHQTSPKAWFECLKDLLVKNGFEIGKANSTLLTHKFDH
jgi:hypothetical protein